MAKLSQKSAVKKFFCTLLLWKTDKKNPRVALCYTHKNLNLIDKDRNMSEMCTKKIFTEVYRMFDGG